MEVATVSFLGDAKRFLGDAKSSLGDAESCPLAMSLRRSLCSLCSSPSTTQETVASLSKEAAAAETSRRELVGMRQMAAATEVEASRERKKREAHVAEARAAEATAASALQRERSASAAEVETLRRERVSMREKLDALSKEAATATAREALVRSDRLKLTQALTEKSLHLTKAEARERELEVRLAAAACAAAIATETHRMERTSGVASVESARRELASTRETVEALESEQVERRALTTERLAVLEAEAGEARAALERQRTASNAEAESARRERASMQETVKAMERQAERQAVRSPTRLWRDTRHAQGAFYHSCVSAACVQCPHRRLSGAGNQVTTERVESRLAEAKAKAEEYEGAFDDERVSDCSQ
jgi:Tfp pilus assembly protein PilO